MTRTQRRAWGLVAAGSVPAGWVVKCVLTTSAEGWGLVAEALYSGLIGVCVVLGVVLAWVGVEEGAGVGSEGTVRRCTVEALFTVVESPRFFSRLLRLVVAVGKTCSMGGAALVVWSLLGRFGLGAVLDSSVVLAVSLLVVVLGRRWQASVGAAAQLSRKVGPEASLGGVS